MNAFARAVEAAVFRSDEIVEFELSEAESGLAFALEGGVPRPRSGWPAYLEGDLEQYFLVWAFGVRLRVGGETVAD